MGTVAGPRTAEAPGLVDPVLLGGRREDIQALRGVAVLLVVLYHCRALVPGGFVGVDIFFVISGFVIGGVILRELTSCGVLSLVQFAARRIRRLLPPLAALLIVVTLTAPLLAPAGGAGEARSTAVSAALLGANIHLYHATQGGYFTPAAELNPLLHTWSLSVEEQFYLVIPALLLGAWTLGRRWRRRMLAVRATIIAIIAVSFTIGVVATSSRRFGPFVGRQFAFYLPFTRAWEFAAGMLLAAAPGIWFTRRAARLPAIAAGAGLIAFAALKFSPTTAFPGAAAVLPVLGTMLLIYGRTTIHEERSAIPLLFQPLARLGNISYSWYLWHWPIIVYAGALLPYSGRRVQALAAAGALIPAELSYRLLERRFRQWRIPVGRRTTVPLLAALCSVLPILATRATAPEGRYLNGRARLIQFARAGLVHSDGILDCDRNLLVDNAESKCTFGGTDIEKSVVLLGDSNAKQFSEAFISATKRAGIPLRLSTRNVCPFVDAALYGNGKEATPCWDYIRQAMAILESHPAKVVVLANSTDGYLGSENLQFADPVTGRISSVVEKKSIFEAGLERVIARLRSAGSRVVVVNVIPKPIKPYTADTCSRFAILIGDSQCFFADFSISQSVSLRIANDIENEAARSAGAEIWNFAAEICPDGVCRAVQRGTGMVVWRDGAHITADMSTALADRTYDNLVRSS